MLIIKFLLTFKHIDVIVHVTYLHNFDHTWIQTIPNNYTWCMFISALRAQGKWLKEIKTHMKFPTEYFKPWLFLFNNVLNTLFQLPSKHRLVKFQKKSKVHFFVLLGFFLQIYMTWFPPIHISLKLNISTKSYKLL